MNKLHSSVLGKYRNILKLRGYSDRSISIYVHYVEKCIITFDKPALHITANDVKKYLETFNYSSTSQQNQIYSSLKLFCKYILEFKKIDKIFLERPRKEKSLPRVIDHEFLSKKLNSIENLKHEALLKLTYSCGLRVGDIINLKISDIDSGRMIIHIKNGKGKKDRIVPLSESMLRLLRKYYNKYKPILYLFNGVSGQQYTPSSCNKLVKRHIGESYHMHMLRHSSATYMLENGTDIMTIQSILGHNSVKTTMIYTHVSVEHLNKAACPC